MLLENIIRDVIYGRCLIFTVSSIIKLNSSQPRTLVLKKA